MQKQQKQLNGNPAKKSFVCSMCVEQRVPRHGQLIVELFGAAGAVVPLLGASALSIPLERGAVRAAAAEPGQVAAAAAAARRRLAARAARRQGRVGLAQRLVVAAAAAAYAGRGSRGRPTRVKEMVNMVLATIDIFKCIQLACHLHF
jgi:hypothetical protein